MHYEVTRSFHDFCNFGTSQCSVIYSTFSGLTDYFLSPAKRRHYLRLKQGRVALLPVTCSLSHLNQGRVFPMLQHWCLSITMSMMGTLLMIFLHFLTLLQTLTQLLTSLMIYLLIF
jgi:hypothetical protein